MNPFRYPKGRHLRKLQPGTYSQYQKYKPFLREEFERKCVYCRMPDTWAKESFGVDHYRPKKLFPQLITTYSNLYYCCNACNSRKGGYWSSAKNSAIPNPCDFSMAVHLRYNKATVEAKTSSGGFMLHLLDLNAPDIVTRRNLLIDMIEFCRSSKAEAIALVTAIKKKKAKVHVSSASADADLVNLENKINKLEHQIQQLIGAV